MGKVSKIQQSITIVRELGFWRLFNYALYQIGVRSGIFRLLTPPRGRKREGQIHFALPFNFPSREALSSLPITSQADALFSADEICCGLFRPFGSAPVALKWPNLTFLQHWSTYPTSSPDQPDIKLIWEPARCSWAISLARAYHFSGEDRYAQCFWRLTQAFLDANPVNVGPNWISAQEVGLRLIALSFAFKAFQHSPCTTPTLAARLVEALAQHAERIPPTLAYAKAQDNNHLLSEAAALFTAGCALPSHPSAIRWKKMGWKLFNQTLQNQIAPDGAYIQHSTNYHRLVIHLALWMNALLMGSNQKLPDPSLEKLSVATRWLIAHTDPISGQPVNLGHNDGSNILPLSSESHQDYRSTIQAASIAFLGNPCLPAGEWDEMSLWLNAKPVNSIAQSLSQDQLLTHGILSSTDQWASLRAVQFQGRPAHADQLHVEIWHQGKNLAMDGGTFQYNAPPPWENALASSLVHNTISVDGQDQMQRTGRFLWIHRAMGKYVTRDRTHIFGEHDGYHRLGIHHRRELTLTGCGCWQIKDELLAWKSDTAIHDFTLQWLLPDWPWQFKGDVLVVGQMQLSIHCKWQPDCQAVGEWQIVRAGSAPPFIGWTSPTYGEKSPALSVRFNLQTKTPLTLISTFKILER